MEIQKRLITILYSVVALTAVAAPPRKAKPELLVPMDYSTCGYHASERQLPLVGVAERVVWQQGDCSALIQQAIDRVASRRPDARGHRGAVLLGEGRWHLDAPLRITASGVVLRGMGPDRTVLVKHGPDRGAAVYLSGERPTQSTDTLLVVDQMVRAGSTRLRVSSSGSPSTLLYSRVHIVRPSTAAWIDQLGMGDFGGGLDYTGWKPTDTDLTWDRTVVGVSGDTLCLDAPITATVTADSGGAFVVSISCEGELTECGVEQLAVEAAVGDWNPKDEDHCWDGIFIEQARDCWVRRVEFRHLAGSAVNLQQTVSRVTVEDCIARKPVSEVGGWRRCVFLTRGQQTLFQRCLSHQGIHDFAAGFCAAGPNAFVQCEAEASLGFSGSIGSWAPGLLFDIVNIDGGDLRFGNLGQFQFGTGWNTANSMFWQCTASTIECASPDTLNRCSAHGCWGTLTGNGNWTSSNSHVQPRSLFYHQLARRHQGEQPEPRLLPLSTDATTSPTVEQAMQMARRSLTEPRLTLEAWIQDTPALPDFDLKPERRQRQARHDTTPAATPVAEGGGMAHFVPWWSGRVKDNFCRRDAQPAITRFVPGREGTGWTDRIDSVVAWMARHGLSSLQHNYGLWYDLRRTDHERVRRADGDVWAPFYEQPFARSGQGTAWDGLSRYDLTRPNRWYWSRLRDFARKARPYGIQLFHHHYFQHNILEAGAHWVDSPWRAVNNVNGTPFPEPVPFAGDKRIFMAEQFYNVEDSVLRRLHRQYIRMCLDELKDEPNVVHLLSAEYTGPVHFTRFWLETIDEWERETGRHATVALSCTRDAQEALLGDSALNRVVDIIDIRYWHYTTEGLWAPEAGRNMAPRQWMRQMKVGKTGRTEVMRAVKDCLERWPDKRVTYFGQQWEHQLEAVEEAGGWVPRVRAACR